MYKLSDSDKQRLRGVHPILKEFLLSMLESKPIRLIEGLRSQRMQNHYVRIGTSKTKDGPHLYGLAIDTGLNKLMRTPKDWRNKEAWKAFVDWEHERAVKLGFEKYLRFGLLAWKWDAPHIELKNWKHMKDWNKK